MQEVEIVEIHGNDLVFGVVFLQLYGNHPFNGFLQRTFSDTCRLSRVELFGQLLGDGRTAASIFLSEYATFYDGTCERLEVYARVLVESDVLSSDESLDERWCELVIVNTHTVLFVVVPCAHEFPV